MFLCSWFWWVAGVSPVWGCSGCPPGFWFSGSGLFVVLVPRGSSARLCGGAGAGCGWFRVRGSMWCARSPSIIECWWGVGRAGPGFLVSGFAGVGSRPVLLRLVGWWGVGRVFFRSALSSSSGSGSGSSVGVRVPGVGGLGGVGLGWGFFSGFCCSARAGAGSCLVAGVGVGCGLFGFCLESLILAQDERWRRA